MARRGRSSRDKLARMSRILMLLRANPGGLTTDDLIRRVGYGEPGNPAVMQAFFRDLRALRADGWRIDTAETDNRPALRVLRTVDSRFATAFTASQRAELARAALCAGPEIADALADDLGRAPGPPAFRSARRDGRNRLAECQKAAADRCLMHYAYRGKRREIDPITVLFRQGGWYLRAHDRADGIIKHFRIDLIQNLDVDKPGTASPPPDEGDQPVWDFMRRRLHDPIEVEVSVPADFLPEVRSALGANGFVVDGAHAGTEALGEQEAGQPGGGAGDHASQPREVTARCQVTNSDAFVSRLLELGTRVRLLGPPQVRERVASHLKALA